MRKLQQLKVSEYPCINVLSNALFSTKISLISQLITFLLQKFQVPGKTAILQNKLLLTLLLLLMLQSFADVLEDSSFKNVVKFTEKHLYRILFFSKVAGFQVGTFFRKRLRQKCFPVNFANFLRTLILQNTSKLLLLCFEEVIIRDDIKYST